MQRSKLQALEHKKMFNEILNKPNYFSKVFNKKKIDTKKYELSFFDEYEDLVNNIFFSKKHILKQIKSNINKFESKTLKYNTIENLLFNIQDNSTLFSIFLKNLANLVNPSNCDILKKNLKLFIGVCGDKLLNEYDSNDYEKFKLFLLKNNLNSQEIIHSISKVISVGYQNLNITQKINFKKKNINNKVQTSIDFNKNELSIIAEKCKKDFDLESLLILILMDTGCTFTEIVGLDVDDIYLDSYLPFIIIRSNNQRKIKNLNKLRTVPLVGLSLLAFQKINNDNELKKI